MTLQELTAIINSNVNISALFVLKYMRVLGKNALMLYLLFKARESCSSATLQPEISVSPAIGSAGKIFENSGSITSKPGSISKNSGSVTDGAGSISENSGSVTDGAGSISENQISQIKENMRSFLQLTPPQFDQALEELFINNLLERETLRTSDLSYIELEEFLYSSEGVYLKESEPEIEARNYTLAEMTALGPIDACVVESYKPWAKEQFKSTEPAKLKAKREEMLLREEVVNAICEEYFGGVLTAQNSREFDKWFKVYGFDPYMVHCIFKQAELYSPKSIMAYAVYIAKDLDRKNIRSVDAYEKYSEEHKLFFEIREKLRKKLKRRNYFTEYEDDLIAKWVKDYEYDFELIDEAMKQTVKIENANLAYPDKILSVWYKAGVRNIDDIKKEEQKFKEGKREKSSYKTAPSRRASGRGSDTLANFSQKEYSDEDYEDMFSNAYLAEFGAVEEPADGGAKNLTEERGETETAEAGEKNVDEEEIRAVKPRDEKGDHN